MITLILILIAFGFIAGLSLGAMLSMYDAGKYGFSVWHLIFTLSIGAIIIGLLISS